MKKTMIMLLSVFALVFSTLIANAQRTQSTQGKKTASQATVAANTGSAAAKRPQGGLSTAQGRRNSGGSGPSLSGGGTGGGSTTYSSTETTTSTDTDGESSTTPVNKSNGSVVTDEFCAATGAPITQVTEVTASGKTATFYVDAKGAEFTDKVHSCKKLAQEYTSGYCRKSDGFLLKFHGDIKNFNGSVSYQLYKTINGKNCYSTNCAVRCIPPDNIQNLLKMH